jgi:hypothetical protein
MILSFDIEKKEERGGEEKYYAGKMKGTIKEYGRIERRG